MSDKTWLHDVLKNVREHWHDGQRFSGAANACPICQAQRIATLEPQLREAVALLEFTDESSFEWVKRRDTLLAKIKELK